MEKERGNVEMGREKKSAEQRLMEHLERRSIGLKDIELLGIKIEVLGEELEKLGKEIKCLIEVVKGFVVEENDEWDRIFEELEQELEEQEQEEDIWEGLEEEEEDITDEEFRIGLANSLSNLFKTPEEIEENKDRSVHNITLAIMGIDDEVCDRIQERINEVIEEVMEEYYDEEGNKRTQEEREQKGNREVIKVVIEDNEMDKETFEDVVVKVGLSIKETVEKVMSEIEKGGLKKDILTEEEKKVYAEMEERETEDGLKKVVEIENSEEEDEEELLGYEDDYEYDNDEVVEEEILDKKETKREWVEITEDGKEVRVEEIITKTRSRRYLY